MGAGGERSDRLRVAGDCVEPMRMRAGAGEWQRLYF